MFMMTMNLEMFMFYISFFILADIFIESFFIDSAKLMYFWYLKSNIKFIWKILYMEQFINISRCYHSTLGSQNQFCNFL